MSPNRLQENNAHCLILPRNPNDWLPWKATERVSTYSALRLLFWMVGNLLGPCGNIGNGAPSLPRDMIARTPGRAASPLAGLRDPIQASISLWQTPVQAGTLSRQFMFSGPTWLIPSSPSGHVYRHPAASRHLPASTIPCPRARSRPKSRGSVPSAKRAPKSSGSSFPLTCSWT